MGLRRSAQRFELVVLTDGRPVIDGLFATLPEARDRADYLLSLNRYPLVRILQIDADERERCVFEDGPGQIKRAPGVNQNVTSHSAGVATTICKSVNDVYGLPSRMLLLRLLRAWWDEKGVLPTETLHDHLALKVLERTDGVYVPALGLLAKIQSVHSTDAGRRISVRQDELSRLFAEARKLATTAEQDMGECAHALDRGGMTSLFADLERFDPAVHQRRITFAFAMRLRPLADWSERLTSLVALCKQDYAPFDRVVDGFIAETIDGSVPIREVIGPAPDLATALMRLAATLHGDLSPRSSESPGLQSISALMADRAEHFPVTRQALFNRIAGALAGRGTLTRHGGEAERTVFMPIVERLVGPRGFLGGADLAAALTKRAKSALGTRIGDLSFEMAVERLSSRLTTAEARAGFRLDLAASEFGGRFAQQLVNQAEKELGPRSVSSS